MRCGSVYLYVAIAQDDFGEVVHEAKGYLRIEAVRFERRLCSFQRNLNFFSHISYQRGKSVSLWYILLLGSKDALLFGAG